MIILGIDPGTVRVGYGLIKKERGSLKFAAAGLLKIKTSDKKKNLLEKISVKILKKARLHCPLFIY